MPVRFFEDRKQITGKFLYPTQALELEYIRRGGKCNMFDGNCVQREASNLGFDIGNKDSEGMMQLIVNFEPPSESEFQSFVARLQDDYDNASEEDKADSEDPSEYFRSYRKQKGSYDDTQTAAEIVRKIARDNPDYSAEDIAMNATEICKQQMINIEPSKLLMMAQDPFSWDLPSGDAPHGYNGYYDGTGSDPNELMARNSGDPNWNKTSYSRRTQKASYDEQLLREYFAATPNYPDNKEDFIRDVMNYIDQTFGPGISEEHREGIEQAIESRQLFYPQDTREDDRLAFIENSPYPVGHPGVFRMNYRRSYKTEGEPVVDLTAIQNDLKNIIVTLRQAKEALDMVESHIKPQTKLNKENHMTNKYAQRNLARNSRRPFSQKADAPAAVDIGAITDDIAKITALLTQIQEALGMVATTDDTATPVVQANPAEQGNDYVRSANRRYSHSRQ